MLLMSLVACPAPAAAERDLLADMGEQRPDACEYLLACAHHHRERASLRSLARTRDRGVGEIRALDKALVEFARKRDRGGAEIDDAAAPADLDHLITRSSLPARRAATGTPCCSARRSPAPTTPPDAVLLEPRERRPVEVVAEDLLAAFRGDIATHGLAHDAEPMKPIMRLLAYHERVDRDDAVGRR